MTAYVIAQLTVTDAAGFEAYRRAAEPIVAAHGGRFLVRGRAAASLEGEIDRPQTLLIEFPDKAAAERFYTSPEYRAIMPLRRAHASGTVSIVEGSV
jgi:uncharacterized protein (DUF1330 family)